MNVFMIIYTAGTIGGVIGPLPYSMGECLVKRDEARQEQAAGLERGINVKTGQPLTDGEREGVASLEFECEYHEERPQLGGTRG